MVNKTISEKTIIEIESWLTLHEKKEPHSIETLWELRDEACSIFQTILKELALK